MPGKARKTKAVSGVLGRPPPYNARPVENLKLRLESMTATTPGGSRVFTDLDMLASLAVAVTSTTVIPYFSALKIKKVSVWDMNGGSVSLQWSGNNAPPHVKVDQGTSAIASHVAERPPQGSDAFWWQSRDVSSGIALPLFTVSDNPVAGSALTTQTVLEVDLSVVRSDFNVGTATTVVCTASATSPGYVYYRAMHTFLPPLVLPNYAA